MGVLAERLGQTSASVSTLELNDERGVAKTKTVDRALNALGLARWDIILPAEQLMAIESRSRSIVDEVAWSMALEAQEITRAYRDSLYVKTVTELVASR
jgi:hypothetical protein